VHVAVINGGAATNIVRSECTFAWEVRNVPTNDIDLVHGKFANDLLTANLGHREDVAITTMTMCIAARIGYRRATRDSKTWFENDQSA
jgi:Peptidase dimerisation domain